MRAFSLLMFILSVIFVSCTNDYVFDSEVPEIFFLMPFQDDIFSAGSPMDILVEVTDDVFLDKFDLRVRGPENMVAAWDTTISYNLYGENAEIALSLVIPDNIPAGKYNMSCTSYDARTRVGEETVGIFVQNTLDTEPPVLSLENDTLSTFTGSAFVRIAGIITDNEVVSKVRFEVWDTATNTMLDLVERNELDTTTYEISEFLNNPLLGQHGESGQYNIFVKAYDGVYNETIEQVVLFVD